MLTIKLPTSEEIAIDLKRRPYKEQMAVYFILRELDRARRKHPQLGKDLVHQAAIVGEEAGELIRAALLHHYEGGSITDIAKEAEQTGATALRLMIELPY